MRTVFSAIFQQLWVFAGPAPSSEESPKSHGACKGHCSALQAQPGVFSLTIHFFFI